MRHGTQRPAVVKPNFKQAQLTLGFFLGGVYTYTKVCDSRNLTNQKAIDMEITLQNHEFMEAIYAYLEKEYGLSITEENLLNNPILEYRETTNVYQTNKSGSFKRKKGDLIKDLELSSVVDMSTNLDWDSTITLWVGKQS